MRLYLRFYASDNALARLADSIRRAVPDVVLFAGDTHVGLEADVPDDYDVEVLVAALTAIPGLTVRSSEEYEAYIERC